jgi:hypothetical protein
MHIQPRRAGGTVMQPFTRAFQMIRCAPSTVSRWLRRNRPVIGHLATASLVGGCALVTGTVGGDLLNAIVKGVITGAVAPSVALVAVGCLAGGLRWLARSSRLDAVHSLLQAVRAARRQPTAVE